jgi:hypothetical protein
MQFSMQVCVFLPSQEMTLEEIRGFLRSSKNALGLQLASAKGSHFDAK